MAAKKRRKHGQLQSQVAELLNSNPKIKTAEVATKLNISSSNAYRALGRAKAGSVPTLKKAPSKTPSKAEAVTTVPHTTSLETRFLDMARLIGLERATTLINTERARLQKAVG